MTIPQERACFYHACPRFLGTRPYRVYMCSYIDLCLHLSSCRLRYIYSSPPYAGFTSRHYSAHASPTFRHPRSSTPDSSAVHILVMEAGAGPSSHSSPSGSEDDHATRRNFSQMTSLWNLREVFGRTVRVRVTRALEIPERGGKRLFDALLGNVQDRDLGRTEGLLLLPI